MPRMVQRCGTALTAAVILLAGSPARADEPEGALVVVATGEAASEQVLDHLRAGLGDAFDAEVVEAASLPEGPLGPWRISVPGALIPCDGAALDPEEIASALAEAEAALQAVDHERALSLLDDLDGRLCACTAPVDQASFARIPYLRGVAAFVAGDIAAARRSFLVAGERQPDITWDNTFAPDPQQLFLEALVMAVRSTRTTVVLPEGERPERLVVDGVEIAPTETSLELTGRFHLLQVADAGGTTRSRVLDTSGAGELALYGPASLGASLARGPGSAEGALALATLWSLVSTPRHRDVVVLADPEARLAWARGADEGAWRTVVLLVSPQLRRARRLQRAGGVLLVAGLATAAAGAGVAGGAAAAGGDVLDEMTLPDGDISGGMWDLRHEDYERQLQANRAGWIVTGVGVAVAAAGLPLLLAGGRARRAAEDADGAASLVLGPGPGDVGVALAGRWP